MSLWWLLTIISVVATIPFVIWAIKSKWDSIGAMFGGITFICLFIIFFFIAIAQPISIKQELLRQEKERQQILYQIDNMNENSDKAGGEGTGAFARDAIIHYCK